MEATETPTGARRKLQRSCIRRCGAFSAKQVVALAHLLRCGVGVARGGLEQDFDVRGGVDMRSDEVNRSYNVECRGARHDAEGVLCVSCEVSFRQEKDGNPLNFRYTIKPKSKVSAFEPKEVPADVDVAKMRSTMLGGVMRGKLGQLPSTRWSSVKWEAAWRAGCFTIKS